MEDLVGECQKTFDQHKEETMEEDIKEATNEVHEVTEEEPTEEINEDLQYVQECQEITRSVKNTTNEKFVPESSMNNPPP